MGAGDTAEGRVEEEANILGHVLQCRLRAGFSFTRRGSRRSGAERRGEELGQLRAEACVDKDKLRQK